MLEGHFGPVTQSVGAVKNLLAFVGRASDPLPVDVTLDNGRLVLVLSNKKDAYYCVTAKACSCPANTWHPGQPCKHVLALRADQANKIETESIRPKGPAFKPFDLLPSEERAARVKAVA